MKIQTLTPMLRTWDTAATVEFYTAILGFVRESQTEEWASLRRDGVRLMLARPNHHEGDQKPSFTGSLYFHVDDVDALWAAVKDRAKVCYPIETFSYGMREFAIYDNNGYLLQFGQPVTAREK
jgi:uncharacterized glyoxalase superfamily protein PhnB